jgi:hypothetical protein
MHKVEQPVVFVLANLMDKDGVLNSETLARLERGCHVATEVDAVEMVCMGWAYRPDTPLPISKAMLDEASARGIAPKCPARANTFSRDTVGDAVFSALDYCGNLASVRPMVVTSDYHVDRTRSLFEAVWGRPVNVIGAPAQPAADVQKTEAASLAAFRTTFAGVPAGDLRGHLERLLSDHPFYNDTAIPDRPFDAQAALRLLAENGAD